MHCTQKTALPPRYRRFGAVETTNTEDNEVTEEVLQEAVRSSRDPALDALDVMDEGFDSPSNAGCVVERTCRERLLILPMSVDG